MYGSVGLQLCAYVLPVTLLSTVYQPDVHSPHSEIDAAKPHCIHGSHSKPIPLTQHTPSDRWTTYDWTLSTTRRWTRLVTLAGCGVAGSRVWLHAVRCCSAVGVLRANLLSSPAYYHSASQVLACGMPVSAYRYTSFGVLHPFLIPAALKYPRLPFQGYVKSLFYEDHSHPAGGTGHK